MSRIPVKCPHCDSIVEVDSEKEAAVCSSCGEAFVVARAEDYFNETYKIPVVREQAEQVQEDRLYCFMCGQEVSEDDVFCPSCGTRLKDDGPEQIVQENVAEYTEKERTATQSIQVEEKPEKTKDNSVSAPKKKSPVLLIIVAILVLALGGVGLYKLLSGRDSIKVDRIMYPFENASATFEGYDGYGSIDVHIDTEASLKNLIKEISLVRESIEKAKDSDKKASLEARLSDLKKLNESIEYRATKANHIKNSEVITVTFTCDLDLMEKLGYTIDNDQKKFVCQGLDPVSGYCVVSSKSVRVRTGPGTSYPILAINGKNQYYTIESELPIIGQVSTDSEGYKWYPVLYVVGDNVYESWIREDCIY